jgi:hypothetical protein
MVVNAAAAIAVAGVVGVDLPAALDALATATVSGMRMEVTTAPSGATIVNDAYNANPTSMHAALAALAAMDADRRVAVLGLMGEIDDPGPAHREVARRAADLGLELIVVGTDLYGVEPSDDPVGAWARRPRRRRPREGQSLRRPRAGGRRTAQSRRDAFVGVNGSPPSSTDRNADSGSRRRSTHQARNSANAAPKPSTARAPIHSITTPNRRLPIGTVPPNTMNHSGITVARSVFFMFSWNVVVIAVAVMK